MILDFEVRSKIVKIFVIILLKNILLGFIKSILISVNNMKNIFKLMTMTVNLYHLKLIFILVNVL